MKPNMQSDNAPFSLQLCGFGACRNDGVEIQGVLVAQAPSSPDILVGFQGDQLRNVILSMRPAIAEEFAQQARCSWSPPRQHIAVPDWNFAHVSVVPQLNQPIGWGFLPTWGPFRLRLSLSEGGHLVHVFLQERLGKMLLLGLDHPFTGK
jgi:hypothetical protein